MKVKEEQLQGQRKVVSTLKKALEELNTKINVEERVLLTMEEVYYNPDLYGGKE